MKPEESLFLEHISSRTQSQSLRASEYYLYALKKSDGSFKFISWNWAAFFGPLYWMVYRRLYMPALFFLFGKMMLGLFFPRLGLISFIIPHVFLGMFGTTLYLDFITKRIRQEQPPLGTDGFFAVLIFMIVEIATVTLVLRVLA